MVNPQWEQRFRCLNSECPYQNLVVLQNEAADGKVEGCVRKAPLMSKSNPFKWRCGLSWAIDEPKLKKSYLRMNTPNKYLNNRIDQNHRFVKN